ncbi:ribosome maturation factor RimM [Erythrobacter sp. EC-HK427]
MTGPPPAPPASGRGDSPDNPITLAAITGAHGLTGEVRLKLFGEGLETFKAHATFALSKGGGTLTLKKVRDDSKGGAIARFAEIANRTAAEKLRGTTLCVPRDALPPLGEGEYYHTDLIGLPAISDTGEPLGEVVDVRNFGAGDIIEIKRGNGKTFMVPMRVEAVPEWDGQRLVVSADFADI